MREPNESSPSQLGVDCKHQLVKHQVRIGYLVALKLGSRTIYRYNIKQFITQNPSNKSTSRQKNRII